MLRTLEPLSVDETLVFLGMSEPSGNIVCCKLFSTCSRFILGSTLRRLPSSIFIFFLLSPLGLFFFFSVYASSVVPFPVSRVAPSLSFLFSCPFWTSSHFLIYTSVDKLKNTKIIVSYAVYSTCGRALMYTTIRIYLVSVQTFFSRISRETQPMKIYRNVTSMFTK